jgi:hypothetical protein
MPGSEERGDTMQWVCPGSAGEVGSEYVGMGVRVSHRAADGASQQAIHGRHAPIPLLHGCQPSRTVRQAAERSVTRLLLDGSLLCYACPIRSHSTEDGPRGLFFLACGRKGRERGRERSTGMISDSAEWAVEIPNYVTAQMT